MRRKIDLVSSGILYIYGLCFFHSQHLKAEEPPYCSTGRASLILLPYVWQGTQLSNQEFGFLFCRPLCLWWYVLLSHLSWDCGPSIAYSLAGCLKPLPDLERAWSSGKVSLWQQGGRVWWKYVPCQEEVVEAADTGVGVVPGSSCVPIWYSFITTMIWLELAIF